MANEHPEWSSSVDVNLDELNERDEIDEDDDVPTPRLLRPPMPVVPPTLPPPPSDPRLRLRRPATVDIDQLIVSALGESGPPPAPSWEVVGPPPSATYSDGPVAMPSMPAPEPFMDVRRPLLAAAAATLGLGLLGLVHAGAFGDDVAESGAEAAPMVVANASPLAPVDVAPSPPTEAAPPPSTAAPPAPRVVVPGPLPKRSGSTAAVEPDVAPPEPSAAAPAPPPPASESDEASAPFSRDAAAAAIEAAATRAGACASDATGVGRVRITFAPSGRATQAVILGDFAGTPIGTCMAQAFGAVRVPAFSGDPVTVSRRVTAP
jgi:hypothetical protein